MRLAVLLLAAAALAGCATVQAPAGPSLAITIDDLPVHGPLPPSQSAEAISEQLIAALHKGKALSATGFINGEWTEREPATAKVLEQWRRAGLLLANHGWAHQNLGSISLDEARSEITRNEPLLQQLGPGTDWRWFRYPFLNEAGGEQRNAIRRLLAERGYRIAAVTMDFSDWQWTGPYARCFKKGDAQAIEQLEALYLSAARESVAYSRELSRRVHGRDIPYVLLIHGGAFTAHMMPRLLDLYRAQGFRFVPLAQAQADPAYAAEMSPSPGARPATLEGQAAAREVLPPPRTSYGAVLERFCA